MNAKVSSDSACTTLPDFAIEHVGTQRRELAMHRRDLAEPVAQSVDVVRAERAEDAAAVRLVRLPRERARLRRHVAVEEELDRAQIEAADVAVASASCLT